MAEETIREFVAKIGYDVDEPSERRFLGGMTEAVVKANLLSGAVEELARTVAGKVGEIGEQFEKTAYMAARVGTSSNNIRAFQYAVSQLGGSADAAGASLEGFGKFLRLTPAARDFIENTLHIKTAINGVAVDSATLLKNIGAELPKQPAYIAEQFRGMFKVVDEQTLFAIENAQKFDQFFKEKQDSQAAAGIGPDADQTAKDYETAWRAVFSHIDDRAAQSATFIEKVMTWPLNQVLKYQEDSDRLTKESGPGTRYRNAYLDQFLYWAERLYKLNASPLPGLFSEAHGDELPSGAKGITVDGNPVSSSNPLPVSVKDVNGATGDDGSSGGSWWSRVTSFFGGGRGGGAPASIRRRAAEGMADYKDVPNAGNLTKLITAEAQRAGIDPRIMEGIRAGESGHGGRYDVKDDALESSWGPFQLNRRRGLGVQFEKDTGLDLRDPSTIPAQARWVAEYIKRTGDTSPWMGYHGPRNADPRWGDSGYVPSTPSPAATNGRYPGRTIPGRNIPSWANPYDSVFDSDYMDPSQKAHAKGVNWDFSDPNTAALGRAASIDTSKTLSSNITNTINVTSTDPHEAAAMVALHLDRTANDVTRNLQGAAQ
jgi:hypothetical protein